MNNHSYPYEHIDWLTMLYMEKHHDISSMSVDEYTKTFYKLRAEIKNSIQLRKM